MGSRGGSGPRKCRSGRSARSRKPNWHSQLYRCPEMALTGGLAVREALQLLKIDRLCPVVDGAVDFDRHRILAEQGTKLAPTSHQQNRVTCLASTELITCVLFLPEGLIEGGDDRAQQVVERGAYFGLDHHRCRHPGIQFDFRALCQLLPIDPYHGCVIRLAGPLIRQPVGRNVNDDAVNDWYHALLVGREVYLSAHAGVYFVNVVDIHIGFHGQPVLCRHDVHDLIATLYYGADRENPEVDD